MSGENSLKLKPGDRVVFFGDSVTAADPGYVSFIGEMLGSLHPELGVTLINSGHGGDNVQDLLDRLQSGVADHDPDCVSISIGLNDCYYGPHRLELTEFEERLRDLVRAIAQQTRASVVLCTPSIIGEDPDGEDNVRLQGYADAVIRVAADNGLPVVPVREAFISALRRAKAATDKALFTTDGVHMNQAGNTLFGTTWLKTMGAFEDLLPREG